MPELPEVETIRLGLQKKIIGLTIKNIEVLSAKSFIGNPKMVEGKKVLNIWRKAKILGIEISTSLRGAQATKQSTREIATLPLVARNDDSITLLFHLKMTGQIIVKSEKLKVKSGKEDRFIGGHPTQDMVGPLPNKSTRVIFTFSDGSKLFFNDQRRFGWIKIVQSEKLKVQSYIKNLGPEPLEAGFNWKILKQNLLRHKSQSVKVALMDQSVVSGVGNIYANEACFNAKIDPRTKVGEMTDIQFQAVYEGAIKALRDGIKHGGSSRAHFVDSDGHKGYFLDYAYVYGRDKHACKVCKTEIKKIQLAGRGTYFCEHCQGRAK